MTRSDVFQFWIESSDDDFRTMGNLMQTGDYVWALFIGHLVIEKLLKAYYTDRVGSLVPLTHNLAVLAQKAGLEISDQQADLLGEITPFNLTARYDYYKRSFKKTCDRAFAERYVSKITELREWIKKKLAA